MKSSAESYNTRMYSCHPWYGDAGGHFHLGRRALSLGTAGTFTWDGGRFHLGRQALLGQNGFFLDTCQVDVSVLAPGSLEALADAIDVRIRQADRGEAGLMRGPSASNGRAEEDEEEGKAPTCQRVVGGAQAAVGERDAPHDQALAKDLAKWRELRRDLAKPSSLKRGRGE